MDAELQRISQLIREKAYPAAEKALRLYVKDNPQSHQAFYLLSFACDQPRERLAAIRRARKLAPESERIAERFRKLEAGEAAPRRSGLGGLPLLLLTLLVIGALTAGLWVTFRDRLPPALGGSAAILPTAVVLGPNTETVSAPTLDTATPTLNTDLALTATSIVATNQAVETEVVRRATESASVSIATATPSPTPTPTATRSATATPIVLLSPTPSLTPFVAPTAVPFFSELPPPAPIGSSVDVGVGQLVIYSFNRAADVFIAEIGGTVDAPPDGAEWALLEMQLICNGESDCTPPLESFAVVDSTGERYPLASAEVFQADPRFGPESYANNMTYGYALVALPPAADGLALTVTVEGQLYALALQ
jgi:hypothetical protein